MNTILFLAANPVGTSRLHLDEEINHIEEGLLRSDRRSEFTIHAKWAIRARDVCRAILKIRPNIVHFSDLGRGHQGLVLQDDAGHACTAPASALAELFRLARSSVECVILNACFSEVQAVAIARHVPYVICMPGAVSDRAAVDFAVRLQVMCLFTTLQAKPFELASINSLAGAICAPDSGRPVRQPVRLPDEVIEHWRGTCHDLALLFASCLEHVRIHPLVILKPGHTFIGFWTSAMSHSRFWSARPPVRGGGACGGFGEQWMRRSRMGWWGEAISMWRRRRT